MVKSVNKIVKGLEKLVVQLEDCATKCYNEVNVQHDIILTAKIKQSVANSERERAQRIADKLKELIA